MSATPGSADQVAARINRAEALVDLRRHHEALQELAPVLAGGSDLRAHCTACRALLGLDRLDEAANMAGLAVTINPDHHWPWLLLADAELRRARTQPPVIRDRGAAALEAANRAARLAPHNPAPHRLAAESLLLCGDGPQATVAAERAIELAPDNAHCWLTSGYVALHRGHPEPAAERCRRALELDPELALAWNNLGVALQRTGRLGDAADAYLRAATLDPVGTPARRNLVRTGLVLVRLAACLLATATILLPAGLLIFLGIVAIVIVGTTATRGPQRRLVERAGLRAGMAAGRLPIISRLSYVALSTIAVVVIFAIALILVSATSGLSSGTGDGVQGSSLVTPLVVFAAITATNLWRQRRRGRAGRHAPRCPSCGTGVAIGDATCRRCGRPAPW